MRTLSFRVIFQKLDIPFQDRLRFRLKCRLIEIKMYVLKRKDNDLFFGLRLRHSGNNLLLNLRFRRKDNDLLLNSCLRWRWRRGWS